MTSSDRTKLEKPSVLLFVYLTRMYFTLSNQAKFSLKVEVFCAALFYLQKVSISGRRGRLHTGIWAIPRTWAQC